MTNTITKQIVSISWYEFARRLQILHMNNSKTEQMKEVIKIDSSYIKTKRCD